MLSPLRNRFGIPGVISVIALVFAMFGGAYAATNEGGKATSSAKAKKGPRGPKGATGPAGPAGPVGPAGAQGPAGPKGDKGDTGAQGKEGPQGKEGKEGKAGKDGKTGFTDTLPGGKTETGTWGVGAGPAETQETAISFTIPLAAPLGAANVHYINKAGKEITASEEEVDPPNCDGDAADPTADPAHLCVYGAFESGLIAQSNFIRPVEIINSSAEPLTGASKAGAIVEFYLLDSEGRGAGSWAVTAEEK